MSKTEKENERDDYPRMLYHPDGRTITAANAEEHDKLSHEGWEKTPSPIHFKTPPTTSAMISGDEPLAVLIRSILEGILDERGIVKQPKATKQQEPAHAPEHKKER